MADRQKGFTLIELLIVVAIIAILAAIAVPNFLEAQTRSKVSRAKADMRTLATAIESYSVDHNRYPYTTNFFPDPYSVPGGFHSSGPVGQKAHGITTPVSYLSSIPQDVFGGARDGEDLYATLAPDDYFYATKAYFDARGFDWRVWPGGVNGQKALWVIQSKGPDRAWARSSANGGAGVLELDEPYTFLYDSTNGTISVGNIVRSGPGSSSN